MPVLFRRIRGRAAGHVIAVNPLQVLTIEPTSWGGSELNLSDVHVVVSRDNPLVVQQLLEGRLRLCATSLCDHFSAGPYEPLCTRCRGGAQQRVADLPVIVGGKHGFQ